jgi:hypothetical protein
LYYRRLLLEVFIWFVKNTSLWPWFFYFFLGQPIWPVTRSLDRVDHRVGFQNYGYYRSKSIRKY